jgi:lysophospholipase L1-like esterase
MCPPWSYGLSVRQLYYTQVITTWRKAPYQTRRLPRSGIFTVHYAAIRSRCQIAYVSVKPSPARIRYIDNILILRFNQMVQAFLQNQPATKYIDIYRAMLGPDQKPNPALFVQDQIHLSGLGYQMLRRDVSSFLSSEVHP